MERVVRGRNRTGGRIGKGGCRQWLQLILLVNLLPMLALLYVGWRVAQGDTTWEEVLPPGLRNHGLWLCLWIAAVGVLAWVLMPLASAAARRLHLQLERARLEERSVGRKLLDLILWIPRQLLFFVFYLARGVFFLGALGAVLMIALEMVRLAKPAFLAGIPPFPEDPLELWPW